MSTYFVFLVANQSDLRVFYVPNTDLVHNRKLNWKFGKADLVLRHKANTEQ